MNTISPKTVVITGASSGIGRSSALRLIRDGWRVFATVRKAADGEKLQAEAGADLMPVLMDVADRASIAAAAEAVTAQLQGEGLHGLVNVAGIGMVRPVEYATPADLQKIFEVNVFGQIAVTQAFLPHLRRARGRIVNISSVGVHLALPFGGLLTASKSAFGSLSNALRLELRPFGIRVCTIEPGAIETPAVQKTLGNIDAVIASLPQEGAEQYGQILKTFASRAYAQQMKGSPPSVVANAVHHALTASRPRIRYQVGKHAKLLAGLSAILPESLSDLLVLRMLGVPTRVGTEGSGGRQTSAAARPVSRREVQSAK
jgi:NAD(P)-dependent dehydrogenase (short-subunit alcohol dehydrogenase family)